MAKGPMDVLKIKVSEMQKIEKARICVHLKNKSTADASPPEQGLYDSSIKGGLYLCETCRADFDKNGLLPVETLEVTLQFK